MKTATRKYLLPLIAIALTAGAALAQSPYDDVAVLVNARSAVSDSIGTYFQAARGIRSSHIIRLNVATAEVISGVQFDSLRSQLETALTGTGLADSINYIVTTKGMPLKIDRGGSGTSWTGTASVESELTLILGPYKSLIGSGGGFLSPYSKSTEHFSHKAFGIYLVTRLDGYSFNDVKQMIDKSGPGLPSNLVASIVLDKDPFWQGVYAPLNSRMDSAAVAIRSKGRPVILNVDSVYVTGSKNIGGYVSWGSNDHHAANYAVNAIPGNTWVPGAIAETYVSTSGRSFAAPPVYGQSLIADLIHEGASGVKGYVDEPFVSAMADVSILFSRYLSGYNLAESYYAASSYLSWMDVIVGDPKTGFSTTSYALPIQLAMFAVRTQESSSSVDLLWETASEINNYGFFVQRRASAADQFADCPGSFHPGGGTTVEPRSYAWTDAHLTAGTYEYRLRQIDRDNSVYFSESQSVTVTSATTVVKDGPRPAGPGLDQNYPNPFNPTTTITYRLANAGRVSLKVYDQMGREVATLADGTERSGDHAITWNASGMASGTYYCRFVTSDGQWTSRMVLLK
jgi:uncharacterized protein (TIGR03790 family)